MGESPRRGGPDLAAPTWTGKRPGVRGLSGSEAPTWSVSPVDSELRKHRCGVITRYLMSWPL